MTTIPTTPNPVDSPGAVPTVSSTPLVWWLAGGTALVGAGALAAALIAGPKPDAQEPPARSLSSKVGPGSGKPVPARSTQETAAVRECANCATVLSVQSEKRKGEGTGVGAVGGAVLGGVVGHQIGGGHGKDAMTVLGAVGGGLAGHEVEKNVRATTVYRVQLRMDDGSTRTVTQSAAPAIGARVEVEGHRLKPLADRG